MAANKALQVLGLEPGATAEQIREAYIRRSKVLHPDRFDRATQPEEWKVANELLAELNEAYSTLRQRSQPSLGVSDAIGQSPTPPRRRRISPVLPADSADKYGHLQPGSAYFEFAPAPIQKRLQELLASPAVHGFASSLGSPRRRYVCAGISLLWFGGVLVARPAHHSDWWMLAATAVAAAILLVNLYGLLRWYISPLRPWILLTPLHIVKTTSERIVFWPIWELLDVRAVHHFRQKVYQKTDLTLCFKNHDETLVIRSATACEDLVAALRIHDQKLVEALARIDDSPMLAVNMFREFEPSDSVQQPISAYLRTIGAFGVALITVCLLVALAWPRIAPAWKMTFSTARAHKTQDVSPEYFAEKDLSARPDSRSPQIPPVASPADGETKYYTDSAPLGHLEILSPAGANYLLKLVDSRNQQLVMTAFIRGGAPAELRVPLGRYLIKYAVGETWYGEDYLFGQQTVYFKGRTPLVFSKVGENYTAYTFTLASPDSGTPELFRIDAARFSDRLLNIDEQVRSNREGVPVRHKESSPAPE